MAIGFKALTPKPQVRSSWWFRRYIVEPTLQRQYSDLAYPHLSAPGGPCDAFDDFAVREIWLQWASRLGKTMFGQSACLLTAAMIPAPMLFASSSQKLATEVVARTYRMLERCEPLKEELLGERFRKQDFVRLDNCRMFVGWARSVSTLADKGVKIGHANEVDKWLYESTSTEADPLKLFDDRFKEFPYHKKIKEGTPSVKTESRLERGRLGSNNCRYFVPCPKCGTYQVLHFGTIDDEFGVRWDKLSNGKSDISLAKDSSHYKCVEGCKLYDQDRPLMMRSGVWAPEGCDIDPKGAQNAVKEWRSDKSEPIWDGWENAYWLTGTPLRPGTIYGSQLSSLYALSLSWGDIAAQYLECKPRQGDLQNFVNQWLGQTWTIQQRQASWEEIAERFQSEIPQLMVPDTYEFLTCGIDRQEWGYVYVIDAWGPGRKSHTVDYGTFEAIDELNAILAHGFECMDARLPMTISTCFIDSGYKPKGIADFCRNYKGKTRVFPCRGSSTKLTTAMRVVKQGESTAMPGLFLVMVDSEETQDWIDSQLHSLKQGDEGAHTLYQAAAEMHQDFIEQLLNDVPVASLDKTNNIREIWTRANPHMPNDFRDCRRYSYAAMWMQTRGRAIGQRRPKYGHTEAYTGTKMPDGRAFLANQR